MAENEAGQRKADREEDTSGDDGDEAAYFFGQHTPGVGSGLSRLVAVGQSELN